MVKFKGIATIIIDLGEIDERRAMENYNTIDTSKMERIDELSDPVDFLAFNNVSLKVSWFREEV